MSYFIFMLRKFFIIYSLKFKFNLSLFCLSKLMFLTKNKMKKNKDSKEDVLKDLIAIQKYENQGMDHVDAIRIFGISEKEHCILYKKYEKEIMELQLEHEKAMYDIRIKGEVDMLEARKGLQSQP